MIYLSPTGYDGVNDSPTYATESTPAVLMMVFQYVSNPGQ